MWSALLFVAVLRYGTEGNVVPHSPSTFFSCEFRRSFFQTTFSFSITPPGAQASSELSLTTGHPGYFMEPKRSIFWPERQQSDVSVHFMCLKLHDRLTWRFLLAYYYFIIILKIIIWSHNTCSLGFHLKLW